MKEIYSGYAFDATSKGITEVELEELYSVSRIPVHVREENENGDFQVLGEWCLSPLYSTSHFSDSTLDKPYTLRYGHVYYSKDKEKCKKFVQDEMKKNDEYIEKLSKMHSSFLKGCKVDDEIS